MLLALKPPACAGDLEVVTRHVLALLEHVATHEGKTWEALLQDLDWLSHLVKHDATKEAVKQLLNQPQQVRRAIATSVRTDVEMDPRDPTFDFAWPKLSDDDGKHAKALFVSLYNDAFCGSGFAGLPGQQLGKLSSKTYEAAFRKSNRATPICPACLGYLPNRVLGRSAVDREHYFPKSVYPPLALHPLNLVLTCVTCNRVAHGRVDPIASHAPGAISGVYVPYVRDGSKDVNLDFEYEGGMVRIDAFDIEGRSRMERLNALYRLDEQWGDRLQTDIHNTIIREVVLRAGLDASSDDVLAELRVQAKLCRDGRFSSADAMLRFQYLKWLMAHLEVVVLDLRERRPVDSVEMT